MSNTPCSNLGRRNGFLLRSPSPHFTQPPAFLDYPLGSAPPSTVTKNILMEEPSDTPIMLNFQPRPRVLCLKHYPDDPPSIRTTSDAVNTAACCDARSSWLRETPRRSARLPPPVPTAPTKDDTRFAFSYPCLRYPLERDRQVSLALIPCPLPVIGIPNTGRLSGMATTR